MKPTPSRPGEPIVEPQRVLLVVHGFPPRENAGTEQHTLQLSEALRQRGIDTHVLAATRAPGRPQYSLLEEDGLTRVVNNLSARDLADGERDRAIESIATDIENRFAPDLVHVQHFQFLSSGLQFRAPTVITLHDHWGWCAAGGTLMRSDGARCDGPEPERCATCHADWRPRLGQTAKSLIKTAGILSPIVDPEHLHRAFRFLPAGLRARLNAPSKHPEPADAAVVRNKATMGLIQRAEARIAPSAYLARAAEAAGAGPVQVVPHGIHQPDGAPETDNEASAPGVNTPENPKPFVFLGTVSWHKGPDVVVDAWRAAFPNGEVPLRLHGPVIDAQAAHGHPVGPVLDRAGVAKALGEAQALVLGSRWPENSPMVILEARAAGCPVLAPDIGGIPELVEPGRDGWLYAPEDTADLAAAMRQLVAKGQPTPEAPPTLTQQVDDTLAVYRSVLQNRTQV